MKKNKLKPLLTGSVLILPALLLLNGSGQESKAMFKAGASKVMNGVRATGGAISRLNINATKLPSATSKINVQNISKGLSNVKQNANSAFNNAKSNLTNNLYNTKRNIVDAVSGAKQNLSNLGQGLSNSLPNLSGKPTHGSGLNYLSKNNSVSSTTSGQTQSRPNTPTGNRNNLSSGSSTLGATGGYQKVNSKGKPVPPRPPAPSRQNSINSTSGNGNHVYEEVLPSASPSRQNSVNSTTSTGSRNNNNSLSSRPNSIGATGGVNSNLLYERTPPSSSPSRQNSTSSTSSNTSTGGSSNGVLTMENTAGMTPPPRPPKPQNGANTPVSKNPLAAHSQAYYHPTRNPNPNPQYDKVPKPIVNNKPSAGTPEVYQNVTIVNTPAGSLTIFKDK